MTPSPAAPAPADLGSQPASDFRAIPCGSTYAPSTPYFADITGTPHSYTDEFRIPPDTSAYPWPLKLAWWLDRTALSLRAHLAVRLERLAQWVQL